MLKNRITYIFICLLFLSIHRDVYCQIDSLPNDSSMANDSVPEDTNESDLEFPVNYTADSIIFAIKEKKVYLFGNSSILYGDLELKAAQIIFDYSKNIVTAFSFSDSSNNVSGKPEFKEGSEEFTSDTIIYNFKSKKGIIKGLITEQNQGFLYSEETKKQEDGSVHLHNGYYTTCDAENPHFKIAMSKAIAIPNNKIISGPCYVVIEDVPLPIGLPFGYFPATKGRASGFIIPTYGEDKRKGFFLRGGGYYFALSDYFDLGITGEMYTKGSWGITARSQYKKIYKYSGRLNFEKRNVIVSEEGLPDFSKNNSFSLQWNHSQDPKANPNSNFSASVNFQSSGHSNYNATNHSSLLRTQQSSSVSFRRKFPGTPFNLTANLQGSQNTQSHEVNLSLPVVNLSMNRIYPLKALSKAGKKRWYDQLAVSYSSNFKNQLKTYDSTLYEVGEIEPYKTGYQHQIPVSIPIKLSKNITLSPNLNYSGMLYTKKLDRYWGQEDIFSPDTVMNDTIMGFHYLHQLESSISLTYNPKIYGFFTFTPEFIKKHVKAIRHVMTPSVSFSYKPKSFIDDKKYREVRYQSDSLGTIDTYNPYQDFALYGVPSSGKESGNISFGLDNNFEMKVRNKQDTTAEDKKIKLLDRMNFRTSYNMFADSLNWSDINMSASTRLGQGISLNMSGRLDPYAYNESTGSKINKSLLEQQRKLSRLANARLTLSFNLKPKKDKKGKDVDKNDYYYFDPYFGPMAYVHPDLPWSMNFNYSYTYNTRFNRTKQEFEPNISQSLTASGTLKPTEKWDISVRSGYDFKMGKFSSTSVNITRELHCWAMDFSWIPFGRIQSYSFRIYIKSNVFDGVEYKLQENNRTYR